MAEKDELKKIKKIYGENFMKLCRELFPTILEKEGRLLEILSLSFSNNSKTLYKDIVENHLEEEFKSYIYSKIDIEDPEMKIVEEKTPYKLLEEVGYDLTECLSEEEIQKFKKYYAPKESLCTFNGGRLERCVVFFAVKKDANEIKREDFKNPKREDKYGTSVMGIQFSKQGLCTVSIKNRYNHTVNNPDATYGNDLDKITPGLAQSFAKLLKQRGLELNNANIEKFEIPGYVVANDGKYYKYNMEIGGRYYCSGNIIIDNGEVHKLENPEKQILIDYFVIDLENKTIKVYDNEIEDSFTDTFQNIKKIEIRKDKEKGTKKIIIKKENQKKPITIEIDKDNQIIGYKNEELTEVGDVFLGYNKALVQLEMPELTKIENDFLFNNETLTKLKLPKLTKVGDDFLYNNKELTKLEMPELMQVESGFMYYNKVLKQLYLPKLTTVGNHFLPSNQSLNKLSFPELMQVGNGFICFNKDINQIYLPQLTNVRDNFLCNNQELTKLDLPRLMQVGDNFLKFNEKISQVNLPKLTKVRNNFLNCNKGLTKLKLPELTKTGNAFLHKNEVLSNLELPKLMKVGNGFFNYNKGLTKLELPELIQAENDFLYFNQDITQLELPKLIEVGNYFLYSNQGLTKLKAPQLMKVGNYFLAKNEDLNKLESPELAQIGEYFLYSNQGLTQLEFPKLTELLEGFLEKNKSLTKLELSKTPELKANISSIIEKNLKEQESKTINSQNIAKLDKENGLTESEINLAQEMIENSIKPKDKKGCEK